MIPEKKFSQNVHFVMVGEKYVWTSTVRHTSLILLCIVTETSFTLEIKKSTSANEGIPDAPGKTSIYIELQWQISVKVHCKGWKNSS